MTRTILDVAYVDLGKMRFEWGWKDKAERINTIGVQLGGGFFVQLVFYDERYGNHVQNVRIIRAA